MGLFTGACWLVGGSGRNGSAQQRGRGQSQQAYKYQVADLKEGEWYEGKVVRFQHGPFVTANQDCTCQ